MKRAYCRVYKVLNIFSADAFYRKGKEKCIGIEIEVNKRNEGSIYTNEYGNTHISGVVLTKNKNTTDRLGDWTCLHDCLVVDVTKFK